MKKLFSLFIALTFAFSISAFAQPSVDIGSAIGPSPQEVPVMADFTGFSVGAFDMYITFDPSISFVSLEAVNGDFAGLPTATPTSGQVLISWNDLSNPISTNGTLFHLKMAGPVGSYSLTFIDIEEEGTELVNSEGDYISTATFDDGEVTFNAPVPLSNWAIFIGLGLIIAFLVVRFRRIV